MQPLFLLYIRAAYACVASIDPEEVVRTTITPTTTTMTTSTTTTTTTVTPLPLPCPRCPRPLYRNMCNGVARSPCPTAAQAGVTTTNGATICRMSFTCPTGTQAFVWTPTSVNPLPYSGTDLTCDKTRQWRTTMGLLVSDVSCMGPPIPCPNCPSQTAMYKDCTPYGRIQCLTLPMTSAVIVQTATQCEFTIICAPGTLLYVFNTPLATPLNTGGPAYMMMCPLPPTAGGWTGITGGVAGVTCMSNP